MQIQNNITRISLPVEEFGTHGIVYLDATEAKLKRERKFAFRNLERIIKLYKLLPQDHVILSIGRALTSDGVVTIEITTKRMKKDATKKL